MGVEDATKGGESGVQGRWGSFTVFVNVLAPSA